MLTTGLPGLSKVLCLGAHCDDIEIGCGGTVLRLLQEHPGLEVAWVVFASNPARALEAEKAAGLFLAGAGRKQVVIKAFRDGFLPYTGAQVKDEFEAIKALVRPDLILTHYRHDLHQDHRLVSELTWNTWRDHLIWEYEIPKYDGDMGIPNGFVALEEPLLRRKVELIRDCYPTQWGKNWFDEETFFSLARLRGMECQSPSRYAEAFHCRKIRL
ncbi:MAG TPA: PIG-L deacetylase family protein [Fibrobacteria bacterium]|nr:PIG-L deacetylase family protein [Fibrobacteria bacterium]